MTNPRLFTAEKNLNSSLSPKNTKEASSPQSCLVRYFPMIRSRQEITEMIRQTPRLADRFSQWDTTHQNDFLDFCSGMRGLKVLYDGIFKEIFNPESTPERLERLLSLLLKRKVIIKAVLPNDSVRLGAESSLLYTDIMVELEDGSLANIEIQKIGFSFPGERSACYSSDHLLRQYKRIRAEKNKGFNYRDIKNVYTIVFFERSPEAFHEYPHRWVHRFCQKSDTGLSLNLLQEYLFIPLDIFRKNIDNKPIETELEAWLVFLSFEEPERIEELVTHFPQFRPMYQDIYEICLNIEKVMNMYSKELLELDHNTYLYMVDEMQAKIDRQKEQLSQQSEQLSQQKYLLNQKDQQLLELQKKLQQLQAQLSK